METELIASILSLNRLFANTALAFSCPEDGWDGLKDPIMSLEISSDNEFNNYEPGELLASRKPGTLLQPLPGSNRKSLSFGPLHSGGVSRLTKPQDGIYTVTLKVF